MSRTGVAKSGGFEKGNLSPRPGERGRYRIRKAPAMDRLSAYQIVTVGATIGWLISAIVYVKINAAVPFIPWIVLFVVCRIGMRNWPEIKPRLFWTIVGGGMVGWFLNPKVQGRFRIESFLDLLSLGGPFGDVTVSLIGAVLMTFGAVAITRRLAAVDQPN